MESMALFVRNRWLSLTRNIHPGHIIKVRKNYTAAPRFYYILSYVTKPQGDLDSEWTTYVSHVKNIDFAKEWRIGKKGEAVLDVHIDECPDNIRLGKTLVGDKIALYHLLVKTVV